MNYIPSPRYRHIAASVGHNLYAWGGWTNDIPIDPTTKEAVHISTEKKKHFSSVDILNVKTGEWREERTRGDPHPGVVGAACTVIGRKIIVFGGYCGHGTCFYNCITQLDTDTLEWSQISPNDAPQSAHRKAHCGMVQFRACGEDHLCFVGGTGLFDDRMKYESHQFVERPRSASRTNEIHCFNLSKGEWYIPEVTGTLPPPCAYHSLINIPDDKAMLSGGFSKNGRMSDLYELTLPTSVKTCKWERIHHNDVNLPWPAQRSGHSCSILSDSLALLIGGEDHISHALDEMWLLKSTKMTWKLMPLSEGVAKRRGHTATVLKLSETHVIVVLVGGVSDWIPTHKCWEQTIRLDTQILELELDFQDHCNPQVKFSFHMHLDGYKELMQQRSEKEQLQIQVEELKTVNEDSKMKLLESEALLNDRKQGKSTSKQSTDKELARQRAEIEALQKKLNRETEEKTILQDEMTRKDARLQNIKETKIPNSEATIISNQDINILSKLTKPERRNGNLHWRNHGLTIFNLKDSYTSFSVTTVWSSQFEFPENTQLFSHIYWIQSEGEPAKPVEVEMQHCGVLLNKEQCSNMCFGVCNDPENGPPYKFRIQEGRFTSDSNYGKVEIKFSRRLIAIFVRFIRRFLPENHQNAVNTIGKKYFTKWYLQNSNPSQGRVHFVICQNLDGCIENADEYYTTMHSMRSGPQSIIHAKPSEEKIQLVLQANRNGGVPIEDETEHDGWKITPTVVPVEVKLNDVDECSKYEKYHCLQIHTEKTNIRANLPPLKITLQGIEDTKTYFLKHDEVFDEPEKQNAVDSSRKTVGNQKIWNQKFFIAAVIFGLIAVFLLLLFSSPDQLHTSIHWTLHPDFTENELLTDHSIRSITKPFQLCICLKRITFSECKQIEREHKNDINRQAIEVLSKWYRSHYLNWEEVVIALYCSDHIKEAKELAKRKNVDTTLLDDVPIM